MLRPHALCSAALAVAALIVLALPALAQSAGYSREVIRDFQALIEVGRDGGVTVTEDIEVVALGHQIRRGIFRDIPLGGVGLLGLGAADFELRAALRGGNREPYRIEGIEGGVRVYLGDADVLLEPGVHRYRIVYRIGDQVDRYDEFDEIYWNVTGNDWAFDIERASATVVPPEGAPVERLAVYTGYRGERGDHALITRDAGDRPHFATTRPLRAAEGMTVAVGWPKGFVAEAGPRLAFYRWLERHGGLAAAGLTLALTLGYYLLAWRAVGRDPTRGTIVPIYRPELPPAAMRFIRRMGFDATCFAAAVISLAVKGYLAIRDDGTGTRTLVRTPDKGVARPEMSDGESRLFQELFAGMRDEIALTRESRAPLNAASTALRTHFQNTFDRHYFRHNYLWFAAGIGISVLGWLAAGVISLEYAAALGIAVFPAVMLTVMGVQIVSAVRQIRGWRYKRSAGGLVAGLMQLVFAGIFAVVGLGTATMFALEIGAVPVVALLAVAAVNVLFYHLLKAPTALGREALDEIDGTRLYLTVAEADRLKFHNPPERTPEHFHALLPYAVALDVETAWTSQFRDEIEAARARGDEDAYLRPTWYAGRGRSGGFSNLGELRGLGASLGGAFSSATVTTSSGGGSGGGGSSGGGRGGGGGGGW